MYICNIFWLECKHLLRLFIFLRLFLNMFEKYPLKQGKTWPLIRQCLTSGLLTSGFRNWMTRDVGTSVSARHPNLATYPIAKHCILWGNRRKERSHLHGEHSRACQHLSSLNCANRRLTNRLLDTTWVKGYFGEKLNRGVSKPGCFPLFLGKVQIVSRTLSGLFLVGALNRPRKRKRTNRENPRTIPEQIGKILQGFPCFLSVSPFFSRDFRGSVAIKNPCFFGGFPCLFQEKQGKEGQGPKRAKKDKKGRTSPNRETPPRLKPPPFSGPWSL